MQTNNKNGGEHAKINDFFDDKVSPTAEKIVDNLGSFARDDVAPVVSDALESLSSFMYDKAFPATEKVVDNILDNGVEPAIQKSRDKLNQVMGKLRKSR